MDIYRAHDNFSSNQFVVEGKAAFHENISCSVCLECRLWSTVVKVGVILLMPEILWDQRETSLGEKSSSLKKFKKKILSLSNILCSSSILLQRAFYQIS